MIKFVIRENDEHYNIADSTEGYFIRTMNYGEYMPSRRFVNILKYLDIDYHDFNKALSSYGGSHQTYSYSNNVCTVHVLYFINREDAELFIKDYLEPQLITKQLLM